MVKLCRLAMANKAWKQAQSTDGLAWLCGAGGSVQPTQGYPQEPIGLAVGNPGNSSIKPGTNKRGTRSCAEGKARQLRLVVLKKEGVFTLFLGAAQAGLAA